MQSGKRSRWACLGALAILGSLARGPALAAPVACSAFKAAFLKATSDLNSNFVRPLIVTRRGPSKDDIYDMISNVRVDGTLRCRGEALRRFEAKIPVPANPGLVASFEQVQKAALVAAFDWSPAHAGSIIRKINTEAAEYLRASIERGDVVFSGKTERHEVSGDLGMMWTPAQHTFVIVGED